MRNIAILLQKEWQELRSQPLVLVGIVLPALVIAALALIALYATRSGEELPPGLNIPLDMIERPGMTPAEGLQTALGSQLSVALLLLPVIVTGSIAAYSIVGEKLGRTLEPLLATPVATWELLSAKVLAALVPGVLATWLAGLIVAVGVQILAISPAVAAAILSPERVVLLGLAAPLLALAAVSLTVAVSARANDVRSAQQASGILVVPVLLLLFGPALGLALQGVVAALAVAALLAVVAGGLLLFAVRSFQREQIITRWR